MVLLTSRKICSMLSFQQAKYQLERNYLFVQPKGELRTRVTKLWTQKFHLAVKSYFFFWFFVFFVFLLKQSREERRKAYRKEGMKTGRKRKGGRKEVGQVEGEERGWKERGRKSLWTIYYENILVPFTGSRDKSTEQLSPGYSNYMDLIVFNRCH